MDLLMWQMRKNCSLFITSGTLSQLTGNTSVVPLAAPPLMNNRAIHKARLLVSPVCGLLSDVPGLVLAGFFSRAAIASSIAYVF